MPIIKSLRTKGMSNRHWKMIGAKLGFNIDSSTVTLLKLINLKLQDESKMNVIRTISETAIKEYAVNTGLDTLDKEIKSS